MTHKISIAGLTKYYGTTQALSGIDLAVGAGEFVTLVGASGCGKSTLLRTLGGLEEYGQGTITCNGRIVDGPGPDRSMVFQSYSLYPWLTVMDNIRFCRRLKNGRQDLTSTDVEIASGRADALVSLMGLQHVARAYPAELSGGMQQRVAIARALMVRPDVLLMDEPFGALDAQTREVMHDLIRHVYRLERMTVVFVTHDVEEAIYLGDRVVVMAPRPGRIDSIVDVPFGLERDQDLKLAPAFAAVKRQILDRIRETSGVRTDLEQLAKLTRSIQT
ncbi:ABC transporter ATP-binding protein [Pseudoduganella umbonata]|uniref:ABC transporter ATP-binding protein n=1 Tax=Pseudoduganella umbonata TaxID=864828 RepID=A0A4P8HLC3_9BURK|nr:ABC transporter ATP-binding protein [Pseudoduganella umbonata]MBB3221271.1 NitT/TauT family transport system ATP-binding protein [Pseudoduganella umbonata]QCP10447.1 ABC transporter ATP-binding protein [Pseudoduganella umbonata]